MWIWTPGHKPMCDPSGPTIDDYKALPGRIPRPKLPFTYQCIAISDGSCSPGLSLPWWSLRLYTFLALVSPFRGPLAMAFPGVSSKVSLLRGRGGDLKDTFPPNSVLSSFPLFAQPTPFPDPQVHKII